MTWSVNPLGVRPDLAPYQHNASAAPLDQTPHRQRAAAGADHHRTARQRQVHAGALLFRSALALLEADLSVALEANFYPEWDTAGLRRLAETSGCRFVQVVCTASAQTLVERYRSRTLSGERHPGHTESEALDDTLARLSNGRWGALDLNGPVITVDTEIPPSEALVDEIVQQVRRAADSKSWHAQ